MTIQQRLEGEVARLRRELAEAQDSRRRADEARAKAVGERDEARRLLAEEQHQMALQCAETKSARAEVERLRRFTAKNQREHDLVRQQRMELHQDGLIDNAEYAALASEHGGVQRLEDYDALRARLARVEGALRDALPFIGVKPAVEVRNGEAWAECHHAKECAHAALAAEPAQTATRKLCGTCAHFCSCDRSDECPAEREYVTTQTVACERHRPDARDESEARDALGMGVTTP